MANQFGTAVITVTVSDGGLTASDSFTLTVNSVNDAPVANDDTAFTTDSRPVTIIVLDNDSDVDGDSLSVSAVGSAGNGTATTNSTIVTNTASSGAGIYSASTVTMTHVTLADNAGSSIHNAGTAGSVVARPARGRCREVGAGIEKRL